MNDVQDEQADAEAMPELSPNDPAAAAFEALREEVALVRCAIGGLAADRAAIEITDYSETLAELLQASTATSKRLKTLSEAPALQMTADSWGRQIAEAGETTRHGDQLALSRARTALDETTEDLRSALHSARDADRQNRWLMSTGIAGIIAGAALWAVVSGWFSPSAPAASQTPEHRAATILGMSEEKAGEHLIQTASPKLWQDLVLGDTIVIANREALNRCQHRALRRAEHCMITVPKGQR